MSKILFHFLIKRNKKKTSSLHTHSLQTKMQNDSSGFHKCLTRDTTSINGKGITIKKDCEVINHRAPRNRNNEKVPCSFFGPNRHVKHKGFYFCHECDQYDNLKPHLQTSSRRIMKKHTCKANHRSFLCPTHVMNNNQTIFRRNSCRHTDTRYFALSNKNKKRKIEIEDDEKKRLKLMMMKTHKSLKMPCKKMQQMPVKMK